MGFAACFFCLFLSGPLCRVRPGTALFFHETASLNLLIRLNYGLMRRRIMCLCIEIEIYRCGEIK